MKKYEFLYDMRLRFASRGAAALICARKQVGMQVAQVEVMRCGGCNGTAVRTIFWELQNAGYLIPNKAGLKYPRWVVSEKMFEVRDI